MTVGERVKLLRKELGLTQTDFAKKLGMTHANISYLESGKSILTEANAKAICRTFNVDYFWLTEGFGEMFAHFDEVIIQELIELYNLDDTEKAIVLAFLESDKETRKHIKKFVNNLMDKMKEVE